MCYGVVRHVPVLRSGNFIYSFVALHHDMAQRMVSYVNDWSSVKLALDIGCGRGIVLNTVATQLKKTGSSGLVVWLSRINYCHLLVQATSILVSLMQNPLITPAPPLLQRPVN